MPRGYGTAVTNTFQKGLITEATGLNFPENAVTDSLNVKFDPIGFVERRLGIDLEGSADALTYTKTDGVIHEFVWTAVAKSGQYTFLVLQVGTAIRFYKVAQEGNVSPNLLVPEISLTAYKAAGAPAVINMIPASFAAGTGYLFIAHPNCDPIVVRWKSETNAFEAARVSVLIRDFEGVVDSLKPEENPVALTSLHHYNLLNQGWDKKVRVGTVSNELGSDSTGNTTLTSDLSWAPVA